MAMACANTCTGRASEETDGSCAVCHHDKQDYRLLSCLHSFCRSCIDQLAVTANGQIKCPWCPKTTSAPEGGASGLPRDVTRGRSSKPVDCGWQEASSEPCRNEATLLCSPCNIAYCDNHAIPHVRSPSKHQITCLTDAEGPHMCVHHEGQPLSIYCVSCDTPVCGHCIVVGPHKGHDREKIVVLAAKVESTKKEVLKQAEKVGEDILPRAVRLLEAVDEVGATLSTCAEEVSSKIKLAGKTAKEAIDACVHQKLQEVEDIQNRRQKLLNAQHDETKKLREDATNAIQFCDRLIRKADQSLAEENLELWLAVGSRMDGLAGAEVAEGPEVHGRIEFAAVFHDQQLKRSASMIGNVNTCEASAAHCFVEGSLKKAAAIHGVATFLVRTKDSRGQPLKNGSDRVSAKFINTPHDSSAKKMPTIDVKDKGHGSYSLSFVPTQPGTYTMEVFINGSRLPSNPTVESSRRRVKFDSDLGDPELAISDKGLSASHPTERNVWMPVAGKPGMKRGTHSWKVHITSSQGDAGGFKVGVTTKESMDYDGSFQAAYCWDSNSGKCAGRGSPKGQMDSLRHDTIFQLDLDCGAGIIKITDLTSRKTASIEDLPSTKLVPFFSLYHKGQKITLVE